jgi:hypothetical protein
MGWEANHSADRLTRPLIRRGRRLEPASWDRRALFRGNRLGDFGLLRDVHDLATLATSVREGWSALNQAARESRDLDLAARCRDCNAELIREIAWLEPKLHHAAPQLLTVPSNSTKELVTSIPSLAQVGAVAHRIPRALLRRLVPIAPSAGALAVVLVVGMGAAIGRHAGLLDRRSLPEVFAQGTVARNHRSCTNRDGRRSLARCGTH